MRRPVLPLLEPEVVVANAARGTRSQQTTGVRHIEWGGITVASWHGSANAIYRLVNLLEELEPRDSYMIWEISTGHATNFDYEVMMACSEHEAQRAARRIAQLLGPSIIRVTMETTSFELRENGDWHRLG